MYIRMLVTPFLLVLLLTSQIVLLPTQIFALQWCGCGNCWMEAVYHTCTCGYPYYYCLEDLRDLQLHASLQNLPAETNSIPAALISTIARPDFTEGVYLVSDGKCLHNRVVLHLLGNARQEMKFVPVSLIKNTLAF